MQRARSDDDTLQAGRLAGLAQVGQTQVERGRELAGDGDPGHAPDGAQPVAEPRTHVVERAAAGDVEGDVEERRRRRGHPAVLGRHRAVASDGGHQRAPHPLLAELEGCRVSGVGVPGAVHGPVVVADEGVGQAGRRHLLGAEGGVGHLVGALEGQAALLGSVEQRHVRPGALDLEALEEARRARRPEVPAAPHGEAVGQRERSQAVGAEDDDVGGPVDPPVQAGRPQPVVVAGCHQHGDGLQPGQLGPEERARVGAGELVLVQVAGHEQGVGLLGQRQVDRGRHGAPRVLAQAPGQLGAGPAEGPVEVDVGQHHELHATRPDPPTSADPVRLPPAVLSRVLPARRSMGAWYGGGVSPTLDARRSQPPRSPAMISAQVGHTG